MKLKKTLLFSIIILSLISSLFSVSVLGIADINYTFERDIFYNETSFDFDNPVNNFNVRDSTSFTGLYDATFSFTNEVGLVDNAIGFVDIETFGVGSVLEVIDQIDGHSEVIKANPIGIFQDFRNIFTPQTSGTIEFWYRRNTTTIRSIISIAQSNGSVFFELNFQNTGAISYIREGLGTFDFSTYQVNTWIHFSIDFDVITELFNITVNGIENLNLNASRIPSIDYTNVVRIRFLSHNDGGNGGCLWYLDAVGYSWDIVMEVVDFENDIVGSFPSGWNDFSDTPNLEVSVQNIESHNLFLIDASNVGKCNITRNFPSNSTVVEWQMGISSLDSKLGVFSLYEGGIFILSVRFSSQNIFCTNGSETFTISNSNIAFIFSLFKVDLFYDTDTYNIYLNGSLLATNLDFLVDVSNRITTLELRTNVVVDNYNFFVDNITFIEGPPYIIGSNIIPTITTNSLIKEPNRDEFSLTELVPTQQQRAVGSDDFGDWDEIEDDGDKVNIVANKLFNNDRKVRILHDFAGAKLKGLQKEFFITANILNITYEVNFSKFSGGSSQFRFNILNSDSQTVVRVFFNGTLFSHGSGSGTIIESGLTTNETYTVNIYVNYNDDIAVIRFHNEGILTSITTIPLLLSGSEGLKFIIAVIDGAIGNDMELDLDYIGVYANGVSLASEFGYMTIPLINTPNRWTFNNHNIFSFDINSSSMSFLVSETQQFFGISQITRLNPIDSYLGFSRFSINDIKLGTKPFSADIGMIWIQIFSQTQVFEITVEGTKLIHGTNKPFLQFTHQNVVDVIDGVNITESFFYTDSNNKLQFTHISDDTNSSEFIQARFNINDTSSIGARISFRSLINNNAKGFFRVNFTSTSDFIPFPFVQSTTSIFLSQGKIIRDLLIIITDLDDNNVVGLTSGFVDNVKILYLENIQITVITLNLVGMIVPLIIILTPTVALRDLYGQSFIIPMFLLMSLILVIGGIIPIWLFFIIAISSSLFLLKENVSRDD